MYTFFTAVFNVPTIQQTLAHVGLKAWFEGHVGLKAWFEGHVGLKA